MQKQVILSEKEYFDLMAELKLFRGDATIVHIHKHESSLGLYQHTTQVTTKDEYIKKIAGELEKYKNQTLMQRIFERYI